MAPQLPRARPVLAFDPELLLAAQDVRVAFFDVDGVLTDGGIYFTEAGETLKRFSVLDGYGLQMLRKAGIEPVVVTGRDSAPLRARLQALGVQHARYGVMDKVAASVEILTALGVDWAQTAAIGDDWPDLPVLRRVAFSAAPANAHPEVAASVRYVTRLRGGEGAAREFCDLLLCASGRYASLLDAACGVPDA
ncbi:HAD family hydrolase [Pseudacidovorax sp. RU35E]|jgi:3-deoxy-D-manno-octulosonate 8-phosphate phosphatase (KDO 8-P phosphatase)|uniref:KdsC family phosphatase n=1 Tax=Pseudacidovorax sp. RU35E TaxID=1907403 RepID=UPI000953D408|nr:HAD hydrolase family protein [Pseudacidovorax sp. RU35E]SIQ68478.1 3-deoxy-D-manno-octulosonate 8-phosphate phosphatase (KDO 8-P phosphatase) [Pseudacidovorax sp. RU35E]